VGWVLAGGEQGRAVFAKLAFVVAAVGVCACALLTVRQLRIEAAQQLAQTRLRILERDVELQRLRARIAGRVTPERIEELAAGLGPLKQIQAPGLERAFAAASPSPTPSMVPSPSPSPSPSPATGPVALKPNKPTKPEALKPSPSRAPSPSRDRPSTATSPRRVASGEGNRP
jgi:hypothetical protein